MLDQFGQYRPDLSHPPSPSPDGGGSGSPEGVVTASPYKTYFDEADDSIWVKKTGTNTNTGWVQVSSGGGGGGAQLEGDGDPVDVPTVGADETIFYWDRVGKALWVYDSSDGWIQTN